MSTQKVKVRGQSQGHSHRVKNKFYPNLGISEPYQFELIDGYEIMYKA